MISIQTTHNTNIGSETFRSLCSHRIAFLLQQKNKTEKHFLRLAFSIIAVYNFNTKICPPLLAVLNYCVLTSKKVQRTYSAYVVLQNIFAAIEVGKG